MSGKHPCQSYGTMRGSPWWFRHFSLIDEDREDSDDGDDATTSSSSDDGMTTSDDSPFVIRDKKRE